MPLAEGHTIDVVRGEVGPDLSRELIGFWTGHGALTAQQAEGRLDQVVCVLRDAGGALAGINSAFSDRVPEVGGKRFWRYRSFIPDAPAGSFDAMLTAAFEQLKTEYHRDRPIANTPDDFWTYAGWVAERFGDDGGPDVPMGMCALVGPEISAPRPEVVWPESGMLLAGHAADGRQVRIRYFDEMLDLELPDYPLEGEYRLEHFADSDITEEQVLDLWAHGAELQPGEAERRISEVDAVGVTTDGKLAGLTTAYLERSDRLRTPMWFMRSFVSPDHRQSRVMTYLSWVTKDRLIDRFVSGEDQRGAGLLVEIENLHLERAWPWPVHPISGFTFVGNSPAGAYQRLIWFPGARTGVGGPSAAQS